MKAIVFTLAVLFMGCVSGFMMGYFYRLREDIKARITELEQQSKRKEGK